MVAQPLSVRVEHHCVLSQPDDRHAMLWCNRVGRAGEVSLAPGFGLCDLVAPAFQRDVDYPTLVQGIAACATAVGFGQPVPVTDRYPGLEYFAKGPP